MDEVKREKMRKMDQVVDEIRGRFGYQSIQRAFMYQDKLLAQLNAKEHGKLPLEKLHRYLGISFCKRIKSIIISRFPKAMKTRGDLKSCRR